MFVLLFIEVRIVDESSKNRIIDRVEYILNYLLSNKHAASVKITFKKENNINGNTSTSRGIKKK